MIHLLQMLNIAPFGWRILPSQHFSEPLHLHLTIAALNKGPTTARSCCNDPHVLAHFHPSPPVSISTLSHNFCTVLAWMCLQASLVNVPSHMTLISVLCVSAANHLTLAIHWPFYPVFPPHQAKWVLINSSLLFPSPCLLHWFTSLLLFFSCSSRFQVAALALWTHLQRNLSINPRGSLSSQVLSFMPFLSISLFLSFYLILLLYIFCSLFLPLQCHLLP